MQQGKNSEVCDKCMHSKNRETSGVQKFRILYFKINRVETFAASASQEFVNRIMCNAEIVLHLNFVNYGK